MASEERFGYQWAKYASMNPAYEAQFRNWTGLVPEDVAGKKVLDAGCGMGRNSYWPLLWGAGSVTAFDNDERSLASTRRALAEFKNIHVVRHDISHTPWKDEFDLVLCIGVLHHLRNPRLALENFVRALHVGGEIIIWVYSYEGNEWIVRFVDPVRKTITSRLPLPLVHFLAYGVSIPLWCYVKVFRGHTLYLRELSTFSLKRIHNIVFDQLIPAVANYWRKSEVFELTKNLGLSSISIEHPKNGMGWILCGKKI